MISKIHILLITAGFVACKAPPPSAVPLIATSTNEQEITITQMDGLILSGKAVEAGNTHSGSTWVKITGGQILVTKRGRPDFQDFVKKNAPKPVPYYIE